MIHGQKYLSLFYFITLIFSFSFFLFFQGFGYSNQIEKNGTLIIDNWEINYCDCLNINAVPQKKGWKNISLPPDSKLFNKRDEKQCGSIRAKFNLKDETSTYYGISSGRIFFFHSMYINNHLIGQHSQNDGLSIFYPANYEIQKGILKKGINEIYIYFSTFENNSGTFFNKIQLLDENEFKKKVKNQNFFYHYLPLAIGISLLLQVIFYLILFLWDREQLSNIFLMVSCLLCAINIFINFTNSNSSILNNRPIISHVTLNLLYMNLIFFIQSVYKIYLPKLNKIIAVFFSFVVVLILFDYDILPGFSAGACLTSLTFFLVIVIGIYVFIFVNRIKPDRIKVYVFFFFCMIPVVFTANDLINFLSKGIAVSISYVYYFPFYIIASILVIVRDFVKKEIELKVRYRELENRNIKIYNTKAETNDYRVKKIMKFIKENYKFDITRDGIAESIGVSNNYLSKIFNAHTGKRIDLYINELRIEEATKMLEHTDKRIIDVAFFTGFKSLATFNRVFFNKMGKSPTAYRLETQNK